MNGKLLASSAFALVLASSLLTLPASAETAKSAKPPANTTAPATAATTSAPAATADASSDALSIMKYSEDGGRAIRCGVASDLIARAKASVGKAEQEAPTFTVKMSNVSDGKVTDTKSVNRRLAEVR